MPKKKSIPEKLKIILTENPDIKKFARKFHSRLANANLNREIFSSRTIVEKNTDALGRLLTGDETCAAIALDHDKFLIATNQNSHSTQKIDMTLKNVIVLQGSTEKNMQLIFEAEFEFEKKKFIKRTTPITYKRNPDASWSGASSREEKWLGSMSPKEKEVEFNFPFSGSEDAHEISEYPYPIGFRLNLSDDVPGLRFRGVIREDVTLEIPKPLHIYFYLDPLRRRANALFAHLGLISLYRSKGWPDSRIDIAEVFDSSRIRLIEQSLYWEAPIWFGLEKPLRRLSAKELPKSQREDYKRKKRQLQEVHDFINSMTQDLLLKLRLKKIISYKASFRLASEHRDMVRARSPITIMKEWAEKKLQELLVDPELKNLPSILRDEQLKWNRKAVRLTAGKEGPVEKFFNRARRYFLDILTAEECCLHALKDGKEWKIVELLAQVALNQKEKTKKASSISTQTPEIIIVDDLGKDVHAELRLFHHLKLGERIGSGEKLPYFGITQLCCPNCHLFLTSHGMDYRAGKHGKHYANWKLDPDFLTEETLQIFLGESYEDYAALPNEPFKIDEETLTKKQWAIFIVEELGALDTMVLKELGFATEKIWAAGSEFISEEEDKDEKGIHRHSF